MSLVNSTDKILTFSLLGQTCMCSAVSYVGAQQAGGCKRWHQEEAVHADPSGQASHLDHAPVVSTLNPKSTPFTAFAVSDLAKRVRSVNTDTTANTRG